MGISDTNPKKQKNVLGLDFEIPEELSQLLAQEMSKQSSDGSKGNSDAQWLSKRQHLEEMK